MDFAMPKPPVQRQAARPTIAEPQAPAGQNAYDQQLEQGFRDAGGANGWYQTIVRRGQQHGNVAKRDADLAARREVYFQQAYADKIRENQVNNYNNFDVDKYVRGESDQYRRNMAKNVMEGQKNVRGDANSRGMLHSGRRQMAEAQVGSQANMDFNKYQQDLVKNTLAQKQQLAMDPLKGIANASSDDLRRQMEMQQMQQQLQGQQSQIQSGAIGMIGEGVGKYYGSKTGTPPGSASDQNIGGAR